MVYLIVDDGMNKINLVLLLLVAVSAFAVVTVQDWTRQYFIALDRAQKDETLLEEDFSRLQLAQARLSNHDIIQRAAAGQDLQPPALATTRMLPLAQQKQNQMN